MDEAATESEIGARLLDVGLQPTLPLDAGVTIRADATRHGPSAPSVEAAPAAASSTLPRLSIDLGGSFEAAGPPSGSDLAIQGVIGEGGMGRVLLARQRSLYRDVAVKTTKRDAREGAARALLREGATCGRLEHPAIVPVHSLGLDAAGRPAMVMKRIESGACRRSSPRSRTARVT